MPSPADLHFARTTLRRFARATNLLLTGRSYTVLGDDGRADAVRRVLNACGARETASRADYAFATSETTWPDAIASGATLVADLDGRLTAGVASRARLAARDGILELDGVGLVPATENLPARAPLPAAAGRITWAGEHMPLAAFFSSALRDDGTAIGRLIAVSMVLEPKTAVVALALRDAGADVAVFSHRYETDAEVAAELRERGVPVFADASGDAERDHELALRLLDTRPNLLLDDGAHVIELALDERPEIASAMLGAAEETTSGVRALRRRARRGTDLGMPVVAVNDAVTKTRFDNRYGTGQSCVFALADLLEGASTSTSTVPDSLENTTVGVLGFGPVGQGVAQFARALGAHVLVADIDPRATLDARFAGYGTGTPEAVVAEAGVIISATGVVSTITLELLRRAKHGAVVAVAGGVDQEIEVDRLRAAARVEPAGDALETFSFADGHTVTIVAGGECVNISAGEGNPIEIMDLSFAAQLQAVRTLLNATTPATALPAGLLPLPEDADREIARRALGARPDFSRGGAV